MMEMLVFYCSSCNNKFNAEGVKYEYTSPVYGPCWKMMAACPVCQNIVDEYRAPRQKKESTSSIPPCGVGGGCGRSCGI